MQWWEVLAGAAGGFLLVYIALLFLLWQFARRNRETVAAADSRLAAPNSWPGQGPGSDAGLQMIRKLAGLPTASVDEDPEGR